MDAAPRRPLFSAVGQFVSSPLRSLFVHRRTIELFVRRDFRGRYVDSLMGLSWAVIQPLALLFLYTFVFSRILQIRFTGGGSPADFALYLFCGMLPWLAFADGVTRASSVIIEQSPLIKKVVFPSEILPVCVVVSALFVEFLGLAVLVAAVLLLRGGLGWSLLMLPVIIVLQFFFTVGTGWILASLTVLVRDVRQLLGLTLTLWMFLTPVVYPPAMVPAAFRWMLDVNPMYYVVQGYRDLVLERVVPAPRHILILAIMALTVFMAGHWGFVRSKRFFVDML